MTPTADEVEAIYCEAMSSAISHERWAIAQKAREFAAHYPQGSDGRNTFIILAEWIENREAHSARISAADKDRECSIDGGSTSP